MQIDNLSEDADTFTANAFLIDRTALVDAGAAGIIREQLQDHTIDTIAITHSHHDHIENLPAIVGDHEPTVYAYEPANLPVDAKAVRDGDEIGLAGHRFQVHHTPGHRDDHICLYHETEGILFAGDLIFPGGSFGRTDLEEGDRDRLIQSIEQIVDLDVKELYAGHDKPTTDGVDEQIRSSLEAVKQREPKY